ncbi:DUF6894 family protein [Faunimonas pinastri]|uniref:DUF6894 family protein n=1 Tax=Faunimonas pinastri TaxID=1855383 RepID=UPI00115FEDD3|nr:hypothetical protein [Faunimonas pinastri]
MPRYFFHISDGERIARDDDGLELRDDERARTEGLRALGEIVKEELPHGDRRAFRIMIRDTANAEIYEASLSFKGQWLMPTWART